MSAPSSLEAYTVTLLRHANHFLLLQRSPEKAFMPMRWTGLGGHVEVDEYAHLTASALREVQEEAGFTPAEITSFTLRRALFVNRPNQPFCNVFYFTGVLIHKSTPACPEGALAWKTPAEFHALDIIETTRPVLTLLVHDMDRDPAGHAPPTPGLAIFTPTGAFQHILWP